MSGSRIDEIVDAVAAAGAGVTVGSASIGTVYGAGSGKVDDPLRPGEKVQVGIPGVNAIAPYSWWVIPPSSQRWDFGDATSTEITWRIEARLYVPRPDLIADFPTLVGFLNALAKVFTSTSTDSPTLADTSAEQHIASTSFGSDADWIWLAIVLSVTEVVNLND